MDLRDYLAVLRKRSVSITLATVVGGFVAVVASLLTTPVYTASTQLYVSVQGGSSTNDLLQGANFTRQQIASYVKLVQSPLVLGPVIDQMGLDLRASTLAARVSADSPLNSSLINIAVTDESPAVAAALANSVATEFRETVAELERPTDGGASPVKLTVVRDAAAPTSQSAPEMGLNTALGLLAGLLLGLVTALLRAVLDTRVRDEESLATVSAAPVIGTILYDESAVERPLLVQDDPRGPRAEAFRRLRTNVQFLDAASGANSIAVTSSLPGEGKSTTTINLAIALADAGTRVLLVDADLRRPAVAKYLGVEGAAGLTTVLIGRASRGDVIQPWGNGMLHVMASGEIPPNPSELLGSAAMRDLFAQLSDEYDVVLVDTPPLLPVTDAVVVSRLVGGMVMVVGAGRVQRQQLAEALSSLEAVEAKLLGTVLNRAPRKPGAEYAYYRYDDAGATSTRRARKASPRRTVQQGDATAAGRAGSAGDTDLMTSPRWPATESLSDRDDLVSAPPRHERAGGR